MILLEIVLKIFHLKHFYSNLNTMLTVLFEGNFRRIGDPE